jgi:hypothetical protein
MNKALRVAMRATAKAVREATATVEKEARKVEKPGKSKAITPLFLFTETSKAFLEMVCIFSCLLSAS